MKLFELFGIISVENTEANEDIDNTDKKAKGLGDTFKKVGGGVAKAGKVIGTGIGIATTAAVAGTKVISEQADRVDKLSQNMGLTTDAFQEWDFVLGQTGGDIEQVAGGLAMLTEKAVDARNGGEANVEAFAKLGITAEELQDLSKEDIFAETIAGLQSMTDEAERSALASELLGGAGEEMGALLNQSAEETARMREEAHALGIVMSEEVIRSGVEVTEQFDVLKRSLLGTLAEALVPMMPAIMDLVKAFVAILPPIVELLKPLIEKMVPVLTKLIDKLLPIFTRLLEALMPVLDPLIDVFLALVEALLPVIEALLPLIELILPPLTTLIETLVPLIEWLADVIGTTLAKSVEFISDVFESWLDNLGKVLDVLGKVGDVAGDVVGKVGDVASGFGEGISGFVSGAGEKVGGFFSGLIPEFDVGTNFVPRDMIAKVHQGEMIVPKEFNPATSGMVGGNIIIQNPQIMSDQSMEEFTDRLSDFVESKWGYVG